MMRRPRNEGGASSTIGSLASVALIASLALLTSIATHARADGAFGSLRFPTEYRTWSLDLKSDTTEVAQVSDIAQVYVPVVATLNFGSKVDFVLAGAYGQSTISPSIGDDLTLSGPTDVTAQLFCRLANNHLLLQAGAGLPTGTKELNPEELVVAQKLAHPLLGFRLKTYGQGLDLSGGAALALPLGPRTALGIGGGVVSHGKFTLVEAGDDYQPGLETSVSAGLDFGGRARGRGNASGAGSPLRVDGSYRMFGKDQIAGEDLFQAGSQIEAQAALALGQRGPRLRLLGRFVSKSDNTSFVVGADPIQEKTEKPGTSLRGEAGFDFPLGSSVRIGVDAEAHQFSGSDTPLAGTVFGGGPVLSFLFGQRGGLRLAGEFLSGSIDKTPATNQAAGSPKVDLSGLSVSLRFTFRGAD